MDCINLNCYYLHILGLSCSQIVVSCNISIYTILYKTANQAVLQIMCDFYGCPVNNFRLVLSYQFLHMKFRLMEQVRSLKTNGERENVWRILLILKPKYVEDLTLSLSGQKIKTDENNQRKDSATQQVLTNHHFVHNTTKDTSLHTQSAHLKKTPTP
jgi:hypothetical protein